MIVGLIGVVMLYVGVAGVVSTASPITATGDTRQHVDYAWRVYNGDIPKRTDGIQYQKFIELTGNKPQAASANPPLFYVIHAPLIGSSLASGDWQKAIAIGRAINIVLGVACLLALAWGGWVFGGNRKALFAVAVPAIAVLMYRFTRLNVDYALDALLVTFTTLSLIANYKLLKNGLSYKYLALLAIVSVLGMSTKAPYVVFLLLSAATLFVTVFIHSNQKQAKKVISGLLLGSGLVFGVVLAIGWFYYFWNYTAHGNWFTARPPGYTGGRAYKSLFDVITGSDLWSIFYGGFTRMQAISVAMISFATAGVLTMREKISKLKIRHFGLLTISMLGFAVLGTFATQLEHAVGIGSINFRYMLPALLPISLYLCYGLLEWRWLRGGVLLVTIFLMVSSTIQAIVASSNNIPSIWKPVLFPMIGFGYLLFVVAVLALAENSLKPIKKR